jgi:hypothetical protein
MNQEPAPIELRRPPRYRFKAMLVVTPGGICQLENISEGGLSFKCINRQDLPATWTVDLIDTAGAYLSSVEVEKVWESSNSAQRIAALFNHAIGARFTALSPDQLTMLRDMIDSGQPQGTA